MDKQDYNFKINGFSNLNEGEYTDFVLHAIEENMQYQETKGFPFQKVDEIKF